MQCYSKTAMPCPHVSILSRIFHACGVHAATVGVVTETNAEKAIEELKAYEVQSTAVKHAYCIDYG